MGFGSYDESEQEQPKAEEEDTGENVTNSFHQETHDGKEKMADLTTEEMMQHLNQ